MIVEMIEHEIKEASVEELHQAVQTSSINFVFLYAAFVQVGGERVIKVGKSCDVLARMKELKGRLICCWPETRLLDEREVHYRLRTFRFHHDSSRELYMDVTVVRERVLGWAKPWGKLAKVRKPRTQKPWRTSGGTIKRDWGSCLTCGKMFYQGEDHVNPNLYCSYDCTPAGCKRWDRRVNDQSNKDQDVLFVSYEGLAIQAANDLWKMWEGGLRGGRIGLDDLCQESRAVLLELLPKLKNSTYTQEQRTAYIVKSVRGKLFNLIKIEVYPRVREILMDLSAFPDTSVPLPDEIDYYADGNPPVWLGLDRQWGRSTHDFCQRILVGDSLAQARRAVGWTKKRMRATLIKIQLTI